MHPIQVLPNDEKENSDHHLKIINRDCLIDETLSTQRSFQPYVLNESETNGRLGKKLPMNLQSHHDVSEETMQDLVNEPDSQIFLPESDSDLESDEEDNFDYNLCQISGKQAC